MGDTETSHGLLVATHNSGKRREYRELLAQLEARIRFPSDLGLHLSIRETGSTYSENAYLKASAYAEASELLTVADDSGLEVDVLKGAPGIRSARYVSGSDHDRVRALLTQLRDIPWEQRTSRFRCVVAIVSCEGEAYEAERVCEGMIARVPAGEGGFGYDPIFYLPEYGQTMAQIPRETKNRISHRARAVRAALTTLKRMLEDSERPRCGKGPGSP